MYTVWLESGTKMTRCVSLVDDQKKKKKKRKGRRYSLVWKSDFNVDPPVIIVRLALVNRGSWCWFNRSGDRRAKPQVVLS